MEKNCRGSQDSTWVVALMKKKKWSKVMFCKYVGWRYWQMWRSYCMWRNLLGTLVFLKFVTVTNFFITKPTRRTNFPNLLRHETLHVSGSSSAHHQEFIHRMLGTGMSYRFEDSFRAGPGWSCSSILILLKSCLQTCITYTSAECTVNKLLMMGIGTAWNM